jgi:hypothetical protein
MTCGSIYKIQFPNGKHYIGLTTTSLEQRTKEHKQTAKRGDTKCLYNALRKYDMVDTLELIEIDTANTEEELCEKEIECIIKYNSYYMNGNGYNMTFGGEGTNGYVYTEEDREKAREKSTKQWENPEARKAQSEKKKQYHKEYPEVGKEHGEKMKQYYENPEAIKKCSEAQKKRFENPEAREEMREIKKQYYEDHPEAREKAREKSTKQWENPEARKAQSEKKKQYHQEYPEVGKEHGEKIKKYYENNPEAREEMREIMKQYYENNQDARQKLSDGKGKNNQFDVFKTDGTFIKTFTYQFEAREYLQKEHNITSTIKISEVLAGNRKSSAGFVFKYK